jgi:hypothetical protein
MAKPADIRNDELRSLVQAAFDAMRAGRGAEAVHTLAASYLHFVEIFPEVKRETFTIRGRAIPRLLRWPNLGANLKPESLGSGRIEIEFMRESFAVSEAMTYYQFVLDEILATEGRSSSG